MVYLEFIFYGIIQGLTEFIPVSSTAHLKILSLYFGFSDPGSTFSAIIQMGSVFAIIWYFRKNIINSLNTNSISNYHSFLSNRLNKSIFIGTIPIVLIGGIIKLVVPDFSESILRSNFSIGLVSILMSFLMIIADGSTNKSLNLFNHKYLNSLYIGIAQVFAIVPGVSRSGATISIALLTGWERKDAARFSFLLGIPSISFAALVEFISMVNQSLTLPLLPLLVGLITTFFSSLLAINIVIKFISFIGLKIFIYYRIVFGILILLNL